MRIAFCCTRHHVVKKLHRLHHSPRVMAVSSIRVYNGDGAGSRSVLSAVETIQRTINSDIKVCACVRLGLPGICDTSSLSGFTSATMRLCNSMH